VKTPKAEGPNEPNRDHRRKPDGSRPKRGGEERGPIGFGSVMRDVRGDGAMPGSTTIGMAGFDPALLQAQQLDAGAQASSKMGAVVGVGEQLNHDSFGVQDASEALAAKDRSVTQQSLAQPLVPTSLARMTPSALLSTVLDESRKLEIAEAMKELHVELEPEDLGPVVVRLRKGPDGSLEIGFRAREGDAAEALQEGTERLKAQLFDAGFAAVSIDVEHDVELRLGA
jgi:hypothetical protein